MEFSIPLILISLTRMPWNKNKLAQLWKYNLWCFLASLHHCYVAKFINHGNIYIWDIHLYNTDWSISVVQLSPSDFYKIISNWPGSRTYIKSRKRKGYAIISQNFNCKRKQPKNNAWHWILSHLSIAKLSHSFSSTGRR